MEPTTKLAKLRIIEPERRNAFMNMAIDERMIEYVKKTGTPIVRFYFWEGDSVSIGRLRPVRSVDLNWCNLHGVPVVRRMTGGRNLYHNSNDITYSFAAPESIMPPTVTKSYQEICKLIIDA